MDSETKYQIGDLVEWSSQAAGTMKTKRGRVVVVVPHDKYTGHLLNEIGPHRPMLDNSTRPHESYLVAVPSKSGRGKPLLYWPRVSQLRKVSE